MKKFSTKQANYNILSQRFSRHTNQFLFQLQHTKTGKIIEKSAVDISSNTVLISALSPENAHKIGYVAANEMVKREKEMWK